MGRVPQWRLRLTMAGLAACGTLGLAGCSESPAAQWGDIPAATSGHSESPSPKPSAADGTDLKACVDGDCEVLVSEPEDLRLDGRSGVSELSITEIESETVSFDAASASGGSLQATVSVGGTAMLNGLSITVVDITGGTALLRFSS